MHQTAVNTINEARYRASEHYDPDVEKLAKIVALYHSDKEGEQDAAYERAQALCARKGWSYKEGLQKLSLREQMIDGNFFAGLKYIDEEVEPGSIIRKVRQKREAYANLMEKYRSKKGVLQFTPEEQMYENALLEAGLDGMTAYQEGGYDITPQAKNAVLTNGQYPASLTEVFAELDRWKARYTELLLVLGSDAEYHSLGGSVREAALRILVNEIPPISLDELRKWYHFQWDTGFSLGYEESKRIEQELFNRLEGLIGRSVTPDNSADSRPSEPEAAVPPGNTRQRVLEIKTDPATADWSLAQIAQTLGVSRVTVHKHIHKLKKAGLL